MRMTHTMQQVLVAIVLVLAASQALAVPVDVVAVLDNSGSMKQNDPKFLLPEVVSAFANSLAPDARLGIVVFDKTANVVLDLTAADAPDFAQRVGEGLKRVNYRGRWTDIPAGIERAVYELRAHGRPEAQRLIVFLTDGLVDIGNPAKDLERARWLREDLALEAKQLGIRMFGIALSEAADFQLVQSVARMTGGAYFRVLTAADIPGTFEQIRVQIEEMARVVTQAPKEPAPESATVPAPAPIAQPVVVQVPTPAPNVQQIREQIEEVTRAVVQTIKETVSEHAMTPSPAPVMQPEPVVVQVPVPAPATDWRLWLFVSGIGLVVVGLAVVALRHVRGPMPKVVVPAATLYDRGGHATVQKYTIRKPVTRIGRATETNDVVIAHDTVSAQHAVIEYRDGAFHLRDQRSTNGTFVNGKKISDPEVPREVVLKHRDRIRFDAYEFEFVLDDLENVEQTRLAGSAPAGGTRLRTTPHGTPIQVPAAAAPQPVEAAATAPAEDEVEQPTKLKTDMCPRHQVWKATELCPACHTAYCKTCMTEKDGQAVCVGCAAQVA